MVKPKEKGNTFEWVVARTLSKWMTDGQSSTELIRSQTSGAWGGIVSDRLQIGDLAANGPHGTLFREYFGVETKHWALIDLWHYFTAPGNDFYKAWKKIISECEPYGLIPLFITCMNRRPITVSYPIALDAELGGEFPPRILMPAYGLAMIRLDDFVKVRLEWYLKNWCRCDLSAESLPPSSST